MFYFFRKLQLLAVKNKLEKDDSILANSHFYNQ
jgi:hypothetical protein